MRSLALAVAIMALAACAPRRPTLPDGRARFTALADGTVQDESTRLAWSGNGNLPGFREPFDGLTWNDARAFVGAMNRGERPNFGYRDWRLPSVDELRTLFRAFWVPLPRITCEQLEGDSTGCAVRLPSAPFDNLESGTYWSATPAHDVPDRVWTVDTRGMALSSVRGSTGRLLPVRGPAVAVDPLRPLPDPFPSP
jgi:hypothetical protein